MNSAHRGIGMTSLRTRNRLVKQLSEEGIHSAAVLDAMRSVPRHIFVDEALAGRAYENTPLPIGYGQTISQPYIVARMTEALLDDGGVLDRVLEVGTGCGYQTAILAQLATWVYSMERIKELLDRTRHRLRTLNLPNVSLCHTDGSQGWPEHAPYDGIIVTAAPTRVPEALLEQLALGGRLVIPVGESGEQRLLLLRRTDDGYTEQMLDRVRFVSLLGGKD